MIRRERRLVNPDVHIVLKNTPLGLDPLALLGR
jgi:hypothetical protein